MVARLFYWKIGIGIKGSIIFIVVSVFLTPFSRLSTALVFAFNPSQISKFGEIYENPGGGHTYHIAENYPYNDCLQIIGKLLRSVNLLKWGLFVKENHGINGGV